MLEKVEKLKPEHAEKNFVCRIQEYLKDYIEGKSNKLTGKIQYEHGIFYLCSNYLQGSRPVDLLGYPCGYSVGNGGTGLANNGILEMYINNEDGWDSKENLKGD